MVMDMTLYAKDVKSLWKGKCIVTVRKNIINEKTGRTEVKEAELYKDEPCRISFDTVEATEPISGANKVKQNITLYIDPGVDIPPGSKLTITQNGTTGIYEQSGKAAVYSVHKEIPLKLFKEWA